MKYNIIPAPQNYEEKGGKLKIEKLCFFNSPLNETAFEDFFDFCKKALNLKIDISNDKQKANVIFEKFTGKSEEYKLVISDNIYIYYGDEAGAFYALQSLKQILLFSNNDVNCLEINDFPLYSFRGFMLDVGRYFYSVDAVKEFIDAMALHKLNTFHFHLTEDQGWRVEIKKYPLLTQKGSKRSHTNFGIKPHSGFYTQEDIKEIVAYCHSKFIRVIPEFDVPGHTASAIACYPQLSCFGREMEVKTHWGVKHDILCAGKESTYKFVYDVLDELMELFPDKVIHIGGDEAVKMRWDICPDCQKMIKDEKLNDSEELQQHFMSVVNRYLESKGFSSMMWNWDSIEPTKHLDTSIAWSLCGYSDANINTVAHELDVGRKIVSTSSAAYYLDLPYGYITLEQCCNFAPEEITKNAKGENLIGLEAPLWTEYVPNKKKADYMTYPRLGAFAISAWSPLCERGFEKFLTKLDDYYKLLDCFGISYAALKQAQPSAFRGKCSSAWFNRRQLHWQGLHNLIEDALVFKKYNKKQ